MPISATARFSLFSSAVNAIIGVMLAFWPLWLKSRGLDATEIGVLVGIGLWVRVLATPFVGALADRTGNRRAVMLLLSGVSLVISCLLVPAYGFLPVLLISTLYGTCFWSLTPLTESAVLQADVDYGRVRIWGSGTFLVVTLLIGRLLVAAPPDTLLVLLLACGILVLATTWLLPATGTKPRQREPGAWRLLIRPRHGLFLAAAALIQASHVVYYSFSTLYWQSLGFDTDTIGWLWAEGVIAEIALFYWSRPLLRRIRPTHLMVLGGGAGVLRWSVLATATSVPAVAAVNFMHCFTFAAAHLGAMYYVLRSAPPAQAGMAQSLYSAAQCMGFGLVSLVSGALYQAAGGGAFLAMAAMAAAGTAAALLLSRLATNS